MALERPPAYPTEPGDDMRGQTLDEAVDFILATVGADRAITTEEMRPIQRLMGGLQAIAAQQQAAAMGQAEPGMSDETSDFGATEGTEPVAGPPQDGVEEFQG